MCIYIYTHTKYYTKYCVYIYIISTRLVLPWSGSGLSMAEAAWQHHAVEFDTAYRITRCW